jgi:predicted dehydrogenase
VTIPELELVACCDLKAELAERNARFFGARRWYTDLNTMLTSEELDAVMIVGPPDMHYACGRTCLEAGLPVMMEKPPAYRVKEAAELVALAESKGLITQVGHNMRHAPAVVKFKELMATPEFGRLLFLESRYFMPGPGWYDTAGVREGWSYMIYQATHPIDLARHVGGEIRSIYANLSLGREGHFTIASTVAFESGANGTITLSASTPNWTSRLDAEGDGVAHLSLIDMNTLYFEPRLPESGYRPVPGLPGYSWRTPFRDNGERRAGYWGEMRAFARAVRLGEPTSPTLRDACQAMRVCEAILQSIGTGKPVELLS